MVRLRQHLILLFLAAGLALAGLAGGAVPVQAQTPLELVRRATADQRPASGSGGCSVPALLATGQQGNAASVTTAVASPTGGALLVVAAGTCDATAVPTHSISDTFAGTGAWTRITESSTQCRSSLFYATLGASPGSGTVTVTNSASAAENAYVLFSLTGHDAGAVVSESDSTSCAFCASMAVVLSSITAGNLTLGAVVSRDGSDAGGITPGAGETEIGQSPDGGNNDALTQAEHGTEADVGWSDLATGRNSAGVAAEINCN